jgi:hypothetical protein
LGTPRELIDSLGQGSRAEIEFKGAAPDPRAFASRLGMAVEAHAQHWSVPLSDARRDLQQVLACVEVLEVPMQQLHVRRASLEDVFLQRTGRSLRD